MCRLCEAADDQRVTAPVLMIKAVYAETKYPSVFDSQLNSCPHKRCAEGKKNIIDGSSLYDIETGGCFLCSGHETNLSLCKNNYH